MLSLIAHTIRNRLSLFIIVALSLLFTGCDSGSEQAGTTRVVAIATLVSHPALDDLIKNLRNELDRQGFGEGNGVQYELRNANNQIQLLPIIANELAAISPDVTVAITTPVAQAVVNAVKGPIVFSAVSDPVGAGIVKSLDATSERLTGATDAWPYNDQLKLILEITPDVKRLGVIHNPAEAASRYGMQLIRKFAPQHGLELVEGAVSNTSEVYPVADNMAGRVDALFLSSDSTAIGGIVGAVRVATRHQLPLYVGDSGTVAKGGLAAVSIGYGRLGALTGSLVARVLRGERDIPIVNPESSGIYVNRRAAELMGVTVPETVLARATIIETISE